MAYGHHLLGRPFSDLHPVGEFDRADLGVAKECGADAVGLLIDESNRHRVGHPINVTLDWFDYLPDLLR